MSEKKMTDEELAKIAGAGDKGAATTPELITDEGGGDGGGGGHGDVDTQTPPADPADLNRT